MTGNSVESARSEMMLSGSFVSPSRSANVFLIRDYVSQG